MRRPLEARFWPKVDRRGPDECWFWIGAKTGGPASDQWLQRNPYGYLGRIRPSSKGPAVPTMPAHVASWIIHNGPLPVGACVLHRCDRTLCVNPAHLFTGSRADNNRDRSNKKRNADRRGSRNPNARLMPEQVREIRARYAAGGISQIRLAAEFGVRQPHISRLVRKVSFPLE